MPHRSLRAARGRVALPFLCVVVSLAACAEGGGPSAAPAARDSAGIAIVELAGPPDAGPRKLDWTLRLELEVGDVDGPDAFGRLRDVAPRADGGLWVVDGQANRVHAYDEDGRRVTSLGAPGMGPGEFVAASAVAELRDGRLVVGESRPPRLSWLDATGDPLERRALSPESYRPATHAGEGPRPPLGPTMASWKFSATGAAFSQAVTLDAAVDEIVRTDVLMHVPASGEAPVRLADWSRPMTAGGPQGSTRLLEPVASWAPLSDAGAWLSPGDRFEFRRLSPDGHVTRILRRRGSRVAVDPALERRLRSRLEEDAERPAQREMLARATFPDSLPAVLGTWVAEDEGLVWVGVLDPGRPWELERPNAWVLVDAERARVLGRLPIPDGFRPTRVTGDRWYGIFEDELGVTRARMYRIER